MANLVTIQLAACSRRSEVGDQTAEDRGQTTEDRRQTTASQMVNLSNSQMVMNGLNDDSASQLFDDLTSRPFDQLTISTISTIFTSSTVYRLPFTIYALNEFNGCVEV